MSKMAVDTLPGMVSWFLPYVPMVLQGPCPHECQHNACLSVAWGPSLHFYEVWQCGKCHCRAWVDSDQQTQEFRTYEYVQV